MYRGSQLYNFLGLCEESELSKEVLECGAGISKDFTPLLLRFHRSGYKSFGIDLSDERIENFRKYSTDNSVNLEISKGDMTSLAFADSSISFIYSYSSIFHMKKKDIKVAVGEIQRVLKKDGLCFINFLSTEDGECGEGEELEKGEFVQNCKTMGKTIHSFYEDNEADEYFKDVEIVLKESRVCKRNGDTQGYIDYIFKK
ncbi:MAG: class I SAM-dependent methyltransferase [Desulfobacterales bacterium]|nr:class I SAM-dependent methyltransferase [Desulfobacterales bacterium]MCP4161303.1 class I SAM-dependent methyltransferase [Deltaproteobacteria bacterium]